MQKGAVTLRTTETQLGLWVSKNQRQTGTDDGCTCWGPVMFWYMSDSLYRLF
jgi:hypothetical protein